MDALEHVASNGAGLGLETQARAVARSTARPRGRVSDGWAQIGWDTGSRAGAQSRSPTVTTTSSTGSRPTRRHEQPVYSYSYRHAPARAGSTTTRYRVPVASVYSYSTSGVMPQGRPPGSADTDRRPRARRTARRSRRTAGAGRGRGLSRPAPRAPDRVTVEAPQRVVARRRGLAPRPGAEPAAVRTRFGVVGGAGFKSARGVSCHWDRSPVHRGPVRQHRSDAVFAGQRPLWTAKGNGSSPNKLLTHQNKHD